MKGQGIDSLWSAMMICNLSGSKLPRIFTFPLARFGMRRLQWTSVACAQWFLFVVHWLTTTMQHTWAEKGACTIPWGALDVTKWSKSWVHFNQHDGVETVQEFAIRAPVTVGFLSRRKRCGDIDYCVGDSTWPAGLQGTWTTGWTHQMPESPMTPISCCNSFSSLSSAGSLASVSNPRACLQVYKIDHAVNLNHQKTLRQNRQNHSPGLWMVCFSLRIMKPESGACCQIFFLIFTVAVAYSEAEDGAPGWGFPSIGAWAVSDVHALNLHCPLSSFLGMNLDKVFRPRWKRKQRSFTCRASSCCVYNMLLSLRRHNCMWGYGQQISSHFKIQKRDEVLYIANMALYFEGFFSLKSDRSVQHEALPSSWSWSPWCPHLRRLTGWQRHEGSSSDDGICLMLVKLALFKGTCLDSFWNHHWGWYVMLLYYSYDETFLALAK